MRAPFNALVIPFYREPGRRRSTACSSGPTRGSGSGWQAAARMRSRRLRPLSARPARRLASRVRCTQLQSEARVPAAEFAAREHWPDDLYVIPEYHFAVEAPSPDRRPYRTNTPPVPGCPTRTRSPGSTGRATRRRSRSSPNACRGTTSCWRDELATPGLQRLSQPVRCARGSLRTKLKNSAAGWVAYRLGDAWLSRPVVGAQPSGDRFEHSNPHTERPSPDKVDGLVPSDAAIRNS